MGESPAAAEAAGTYDVPVQRGHGQRRSLVDDDHRSVYERLVEGDTVSLDVGGVVYRTQYRTLARWPGTRLYGVAYQRAARPSSAPTQLFFDRDPDVFGSVLDYYRSGLSLGCTL